MIILTILIVPMEWSMNIDKSDLQVHSTTYLLHFDPYICSVSRNLPLYYSPPIQSCMTYNCNMYSSACLVLWWHHCVSNVFPLILCPFYGLLKYKHGFAWVYCPSSTLSSWSMYVLLCGCSAAHLLMACIVIHIL